MQGQTARLDSLQAMRAVAALLVVAGHSVKLATAYSGSEWPRSVAQVLGYVSQFGVDIFFVLSGFVIAGIASKSGSSLTFLIRRAARVFPLFWLSLAVMLALPHAPGANNDIAALLSRPLEILLLKPTLAHPVAWTLVYEIQFYLATALLMLTGRHIRLAFAAWIVFEIGLVAASNYGLVPKFPLSDALSLEFCMGVALALFGQHLPARRPLLISVAAIAVVIGAGLLFGPGWIGSTTPARALLWGVPAAALVWAALGAERAGLTFPRWITFLGDISYSLYMWHLAVFVAVATAMGSAGIMAGWAGAVIFLVLSLPLILAVSAVSYTRFERPIVQRRTVYA